MRGGWANARRPDREYLPLTDEVVERHLAGEIHVGLYPLLRGDTCRSWCATSTVPAGRSMRCAYWTPRERRGSRPRSSGHAPGTARHVWVFFADPVPARVARRIGVHLLREAMTVRAELDLVSYDRLFPAQDFMPKGSFGNLIALPLQGGCRERETTVFLDPSTLEPYEDQWAFLSSLDRVGPTAATRWPTGSASWRRARRVDVPAIDRGGPDPKPPRRSGARRERCWRSTGSVCRPPCWRR